MENEEPIQDRPREVEDALEKKLSLHEKLQAAVFTDMLSDRSFGDGWLFVTDRRVLSYSPNGRP